MRNSYNTSVRTPEGNDNIEMYLTQRGWEDVYSMHLGQKRDQWRAAVNTVMNLGVP
jgi:hypothetical protein